MKRVRRKVLACVMAFVLAFSVTCGTALSAFANDLAVGTIATQAETSNSSSVVYDTVYGVFGSSYGDYALMMKSVTYEAQYGTNPNYAFAAEVIDVVKADGTVAIHSNDAAPNQQMYVPGSATDYELDRMGMAETPGLFKVTQKSTKKVGVKSLDGDEIVPCSYDSLTLTAHNDVMGVVFSGTTVSLSFFDLSGSSIGSISFEATQKTDNSYVYANYYGDYIKVTAEVMDPNDHSSQRTVAYVKKEGSTYKHATDVTKAVSGNNAYGFIVKNDGNIYYCPAGGAEVNLGKDEGYTSAYMSGSYIELNSSSGSGYYSYYFTLDGKKLVDHNPSNTSPWLDETYIARAPDGVYAIFRISDDSMVKYLVGEDFRSIDGGHFAKGQPIEFEGTTPTLWKLDVYDGMGDLVKENAATTTSSTRTFSPITQYNQETWQNETIGYSLYNGSTSVYFDACFNQVDERPGGNYGSSGYKLNGETLYSVSSGETQDVVCTYKYESGEPVVLNGKTIAICGKVGKLVYTNHAKHGDADVWWAYDSAGKWGAINSNGASVIDFKYDAVFDYGDKSTDYALGLENGTWKFIKIAGSNIGDTSDIAPLTWKNSWVKQEGKWYYFANGVMAKSKWMKDSKGWVHLGSDGAMETNKWLKDSNGWCFVGEDGYAVHDQWKKDSKGWCYLDSKCNLVVSAWKQIGGKWYYFDKDGHMAYSTWMKDSKGWVYLDSNGAMATNKWVKDSNGWCFVGSDGYAVHDQWKKDSKGWCYLDSKCNLVVSAWKQIGGKWYYFDKDGHMVTGTQTIGGKTYKFDSNGVLQG